MNKTCGKCRKNWTNPPGNARISTDPYFGGFYWECDGEQADGPCMSTMFSAFRYMVTEAGIQRIDEGHPEYDFVDPYGPIYTSLAAAEKFFYAMNTKMNEEDLCCEQKNGND